MLYCYIIGITALFSLTMIIVFFSKKRIKNEQTMIFTRLLVYNFIGLIIEETEMIYLLLNYNTFNELLAQFMTKLYMVYTAMFVNELTLYIFSACYEKDNNDYYKRIKLYSNLACAMIGIICLFLLVALALSSTDYHQGTNHLYYVQFNTRYTVDMRRYTEGFLPAGHSYFFSLPVQPNDDVRINIRVEANAIVDFKVDVCPFNYKPSDAEILTGNVACANNLLFQKTFDGVYDVYTFPFSTSSTVTYATIHVQNLNALYYMDVLVDSYYYSY